MSNQAIANRRLSFFLTPNRARLSLRAMMVLIAILGCGLGWVIRSATTQCEAVRAIEKSGGIVWYNRDDYATIQSHGMRPLNPPGAKAPALRWIIDRIGPDYLGSVRRVRVGAENVNATMAYVGQLRQLEYLDFGWEESPLTNAGMANISKLTSLKEIWIHGNIKNPTINLEFLSHSKSLQSICISNVFIDSQSLFHLKNCTNLSSLILSGVGISDIGLSHIGKIATLRRLSLIDCGVTTESLKHLSNMTELTHLNLAGTLVEDLSPIRSLIHLRSLNLSDTPFDDKGLACVSAFKSLNELVLAYTEVTDAGLPHLRCLPSLNRLDVTDSKISDQGIAEYTKSRERRHQTITK